MRLDWRAATKQDCEALKGFVGCVDQRRVGNTEPWARVAQAAVRNCRPAKSGRQVLLGLDSIGIGAVISFRSEDADTFVMLEVMARDPRLRGERIGDEMMERFFDVAPHRALVRRHVSLAVQAKVDYRNKESLSLVERWGFNHRWTAGHYLVHELDIPLDYAD